MAMEDLQQALTALSDAAPALPARVEALRQEAEGLQAHVHQFLRGLEERHAEASTLVAQVEAVVSELRREAVASLDLAVPAPPFADPSLSFEDRLFGVVAGLLREQEGRVDQMLAAWRGSQEEQAELLRGATLDLSTRLRAGGDTLDGAFEETVLEGAALRGTVEGAREGLANQMDRLGAEVENQRVQGSRDIEQLTKDVAALEAALVDRVERNRDAIRLDADRIIEETQRQAADLQDTLTKALDRVAEAVRSLDELLRAAEDDSASARRGLTPMFGELANHITQLKQAIESVRDAARSMGIPF